MAIPPRQRRELEGTGGNLWDGAALNGALHTEGPGSGLLRRLFADRRHALDRPHFVVERGVHVPRGEADVRVTHQHLHGFDLRVGCVAQPRPVRVAQAVKIREPLVGLVLDRGLGRGVVILKHQERLLGQHPHGLAGRLVADVGAEAAGHVAPDRLLVALAVLAVLRLDHHDGRRLVQEEVFGGEGPDFVGPQAARDGQQVHQLPLPAADLHVHPPAGGGAQQALHFVFGEGTPAVNDVGGGVVGFDPPDLVVEAGVTCQVPREALGRFQVLVARFEAQLLRVVQRRHGEQHAVVCEVRNRRRLHHLKEPRALVVNGVRLFVGDLRRAAERGELFQEGGQRLARVVGAPNFLRRDEAQAAAVDLAAGVNGPLARDLVVGRNALHVVHVQLHAGDVGQVLVLRLTPCLGLVDRNPWCALFQKALRCARVPSSRARKAASVRLRQ
ncbi:MAG TPA: hypothetical protein VG269_26865 [Tepidisphaeraceae bacterium]|nr:hypothetical protein [Tepidisphaeraceae bacterium]